jgi:hypothetical protein
MRSLGTWENPAIAPKSLSIALSDAFLHVIYEHRYFTLAAAASDRFGLPSCDPATQRKANELLPSIGVLIRDSLLIHARFNRQQRTVLSDPRPQNAATDI